MSLKHLLKRTIQGLFLVLLFPCALLSGFGHFMAAYTFFAQLFALAPGIPGSYLRAAFYKYTLRESSIDIVVSFGSFFSRREAAVGPFVSIGSYCVIGKVRIGARTQIASHVDIPSGRYQHTRDATGRFAGSADTEVVIGEDCWLGESVVVIANVGAGTTIGAGSVVVKDIPARSVAVGNPARVTRTATGPEQPE
jgi:acetyltransferase-like isoleucine patch superfamily enzyme